LPILATLRIWTRRWWNVLTKPKNALVKQYQKMFASKGLKLVFTPGSLEAVAELAITRGSGARGLRSILESILLDTMFELA
jgi:ATP-dependent Clp protease ATP-binding subunit ClpX